MSKENKRKQTHIAIIIYSNKLISLERARLRDATKATDEREFILLFICFNHFQHICLWNAMNWKIQHLVRYIPLCTDHIMNAMCIAIQNKNSIFRFINRFELVQVNLISAPINYDADSSMNQHKNDIFKMPISETGSLHLITLQTTDTK